MQARCSRVSPLSFRWFHWGRADAVREIRPPFAPPASTSQPAGRPTASLRQRRAQADGPRRSPPAPSAPSDNSRAPTGGGGRFKLSPKRRKRSAHPSPQGQRPQWGLAPPGPRRACWPYLVDPALAWHSLGVALQVILPLYGRDRLGQGPGGRVGLRWPPAPSFPPAWPADSPGKEGSRPHPETRPASARPSVCNRWLRLCFPKTLGAAAMSLNRFPKTGPPPAPELLQGGRGGVEICTHAFVQHSVFRLRGYEGPQDSWVHPPLSESSRSLTAKGSLLCPSSASSSSSLTSPSERQPCAQQRPRSLARVPAASGHPRLCWEARRRCRI